MEKEIKKIEDELFCSNFELGVLSGIVNYGQLERWVPNFCSKNTEFEHQQRYNWVSELVKNKDVLDIACGVGKGSYIISANGGAKSVLGCDVSEETIKYASIKNCNANLNFAVMDAQNITLEKKFDLVVSFETIEHLERPELFLESVKKVMASGGNLIVSTPIAKTTASPANTFHKQEWSLVDFKKLISKDFEIIKIYLQLYPHKNNIFGKILRRLKKILSGNKLKNNDHNDQPSIREFNTTSDLIAKNLLGYQIFICRLKK